MVNLIFESHATSLDNEKSISSGWSDVKLSSKGKQQAKGLGSRYQDREIHAVFCSDLLRAVETASIAFGEDPMKIFVDWRLRECNYGSYSKRPTDIVEPEKLKRIDIPFPEGESYQDCLARTKSFLDDLKSMFDGKTVIVIGHAAPRHCLEHLIKGKSLKQILSEEFKW